MPLDTGNQLLKYMKLWSTRPINAMKNGTPHGKKAHMAKNEEFWSS